MQWTVHGERAIYESPWVSLCLVDVEISDGFTLAGLQHWRQFGASP